MLTGSVGSRTAALRTPQRDIKPLTVTVRCEDTAFQKVMRPNEVLCTGPSARLVYSKRSAGSRCAHGGREDSGSSSHLQAKEKGSGTCQPSCSVGPASAFAKTVRRQSCYLGHPACRISLQQPHRTRTHPFRVKVPPLPMLRHPSKDFLKPGGGFFFHTSTHYARTQPDSFHFPKSSI